MFDCFLGSMLDEFGTEMEHTESRLDTTMKKMAKVLKISNGKSSDLFTTNLLFLIIFL